MQEEIYIAGMPHLAYEGLSEHWLLKECGHRHWLGLAELNHQALPEFHDVSGNKAYAAFTAVRICAKSLAGMAENQAFTIHSDVTRVGPARYLGEHTVTSRSFQCARVSLLSTFVFRREYRNNQSVSRASFKAEPAEFNGDRAALEDWMAFARQARSGHWVEHLGIQRYAAGEQRTLSYVPCPYTDFNGANFLYFASFQNYVDKAEWHWFGTETLWALETRELYYYGNINLGDTLTLRLCSVANTDGALRHWCAIYNGQQMKIADVFTVKRKASHADGET